MKTEDEIQSAILETLRAEYGWNKENQQTIGVVRDTLHLLKHHTELFQLPSDLKELKDITDEEKQQMITILWPESMTATIKDVDFIIQHFTGEMEGGLDVREAIGAWQFLSLRGYRLPVYFPVQRAEEKEAVGAKCKMHGCENLAFRNGFCGKHL